MKENFSLWCDFIEREFLQNEFEELLNQGAFCGATSNPAIFANALKNPIYKNSIIKLKGLKAKDIYENIAIEDIRLAGEKMLKIWEKNHDDGYISLEIDPFLGENIGKSIDEGRRLYKAINLPNVMIKVPATQSGYEIMETLMQEKIAVNATLVFTLEQTRQCFEAFKNGRKNTDTRGVISVFVSRFDRAVDSKLQSNLQRKLGILNAQQCYLWVEEQHINETRILFASTGVKDKKIPKDYYIQELMHPHSINTAPLEAIRAYLENSKIQNDNINIENHKINTELKIFKEKLQTIGIEYEKLAKDLMSEGLKTFEEAFESMLRNLSSKI